MYTKIKKLLENIFTISFFGKVKRYSGKKLISKSLVGGVGGFKTLEERKEWNKTKLTIPITPEKLVKFAAASTESFCGVNLKTTYDSATFHLDSAILAPAMKGGVPRGPRKPVFSETPMDITQMFWEFFRWNLGDDPKEDWMASFLENSLVITKEVKGAEVDIKATFNFAKEKSPNEKAFIEKSAPLFNEFILHLLEKVKDVAVKQLPHVMKDKKLCKSWLGQLLLYSLVEEESPREIEKNLITSFMKNLVTPNFLEEIDATLVHNDFFDRKAQEIAGNVKTFITPETHATAQMVAKMKIFCRYIYWIPRTLVLLNKYDLSKVI